MKLRVLIVEDSADDTKLLVRVLTRQGFEVTWKRVDTQEAMQAALDGGVWDLVLADHTMPEFNAPAALETLKRSGLDLPFIIVSGLIGEAVAVDAMKAGAHDYVMKGNMARLVPAIKRELQEAEVRRQRRLADEALHKAYAELELRVQERTEELAATNEELAAANEELAAASEELRLQQVREIDRLQELDRQKDEFLSIAAHELRTPITSLQGFAQTLLRQLEKQGTVEPERLNRGLQTIVRQAHKLTALVAQLLDLSRIEAGRLTLERQWTDLVRIVAEVAAAEPSAKITVQAPPRAEAFVDPLRIEQVITNIVNNAIRYGDNGPVEISLAANDGTLDIAVRDYGPGIAPKHLPRIFDRFYQASGGSGGGLGLGLYISKQIVDLHGGEIWAECPPDGGTRFVVGLPISTATAPARRVLLVEDDPNDVKLTQTAFARIGMAESLDVASDGVEALEYLQGTGQFTGRNADDLPAVILLDLKMPRMNGIELLQKIRVDDRTKLVPVVVLTNSDQDRDKLESYGLGANSYVRKPITFTRFIEAVRQLGVTWLNLNSPPWPDRYSDSEDTKRDSGSLQ